MKPVLVGFIVLLSAGCATPKEINGQKVIRTKWVNGQVVYVVEGNKEVMAKASDEAKAASKGVVFKPAK